jgi:hypothetical protein
MATALIVIDIIVIGYSISLFLRNPNQAIEPTSLRVSQWSGYMVAPDDKTPSPLLTGVSASWTVPQVKPSENNTFSGVWVGIGGYGEDTLIQTGTEQEYIHGRGSYYAWYELLPAHLVRIPSLHVRSGDLIMASLSLVSQNASTWSIEINDVTRGEQFKKIVVYNSSMQSAEWILERPLVNDAISTLANFGNATFTECKATISGVTGTLGNFSYVQLIMHENGDTPLVSVSPINEMGSGFTVTYIEPSTAITMIDYVPVQNGDVFLARTNPGKKKVLNLRLQL